LSLGLVLRLDGLVGIAMEGLSPADQSKAPDEAAEIGAGTKMKSIVECDATSVWDLASGLTVCGAAPAK
jgi:hypothetical protein